MSASPAETFRYDAFISYRHVEPDRRWAKWLHGALETYRVPKELVAKGFQARLTRVFRDEEELPANADLSKEITAALDQSKFLIVVCSPRAPQSKWVNAEVEHFRKLGRHDRILALLIEGEPRDAFPPALTAIRRNITDAVSGHTREEIEAVEPLAADVRPERSDTKAITLRRHARLRLIACILGCRFDDLRQREQERRLRQVVRLAAAMAILVVVVGSLATIAVIARQDADKQRVAANNRATEARFGAYVANLLAADSSLLANEPARVRARLDACPKDLRGWEWGWLNARADTSLTTLRGHRHEVKLAVFSQDGQRVATAGNDDTARIWDARTGTELATVRATAATKSIAFSPDGTRLLAAGDDNAIRVFDVSTGKELVVMKGHSSLIESVAFGPDGRDVVSVSFDNSAREWDGLTGEELSRFGLGESPLRSASFGAEGNVLLTVSRDGIARLWDLSFEMPMPVSVPEAAVSTAALSRDGTRVLTVSGGTGRISDTQTGALLGTLPAPEDGCQLALFSADGTHLAMATYDTVWVWDTRTLTKTGVLRGHTGVINSVVFASDGKRIITASEDKTVRTWSIGGDSLLVMRGHDDGVASAAFSADGRLAVSSSYDQTARVWDASVAPEPALVLQATDGVVAVFGPDGNSVVTVTEAAPPRTWDANTGDSLEGLDLTGIAFSDVRLYDGKAVVTDNSGDLRLISLATGKQVAVYTREANSDRIGAFSPDGDRILAISSDHTVIIRNVRTRATIAVLSGHERRISSAEFSPDGARVLTASDDGTARVWEAATGRQLALIPGHTDEFNASFSPNGALVVTASHDKTARVWDSATGRSLVVLRGHDDWVTVAEFSPDGTRVVTGSRDNTVRIWDTASGQELAVMRGHFGMLVSVAFSPDGTRIVTGSSDETARIWDSIPHRIRYAESLALSRRGASPDFVARFLGESRGKAPATYISDPMQPVPPTFYSDNRP